MSVSGELLCSFELLKPLDSTALKQQMKKSRNRRSTMMHQSPVSTSGMSTEKLFTNQSFSLQSWPLRVTKRLSYPNLCIYLRQIF